MKVTKLKVMMMKKGCGSIRLGWKMQISRQAVFEMSKKGIVNPETAKRYAKGLDCEPIDVQGWTNID